MYAEFPPGWLLPEAARARGRHGGRPKALDREDAMMAFELHQSNKASIDAISKRFGVAKRTLYRYLERQKTGKTDSGPVSS